MMRALVVMVWGMGVLIVIGTGVVAVTILQRSGMGAGAPPPANLTMQEPPGTRITGIAPLGDRLAVSLSGGGPDRIAVIDPRHPGPPAHITLAQ